MEDVNNLLNSGEVPNLFPMEEKLEIIEKMRQIDRQRDKSVQTDGSAASLFNFFVTVSAKINSIISCLLLTKSHIGHKRTASYNPLHVTDR